MKVRMHWRESVDYTSTVDVDEAEIVEWFRAIYTDQRPPEQFTLGQIEQFLAEKEDRWFEQVIPARDFDGVSSREVSSVDELWLS